MPTTVIRNADWVIAWDEAASRQVYRRGVDLAFTGNSIDFIGPGYAGAADRVIDGAGLMVMPGLVDIHSHPHHEPLYRGIREEHGVANMHMTGLYERGQAFSAPDDEARAAAHIDRGDRRRLGQHHRRAGDRRPVFRLADQDAGHVGDQIPCA